MIKLNGHIVTPTIFPDKTSQVWKVPTEYFHAPDNVITWEFENEAELLHVAQLKSLVYRVTGFWNVVLELPYLPYARQDKEYSNMATFALRTFAELLNSLGFHTVKVFDAHNPHLSQELILNLEIETPDVAPILKELNAALAYPDKGAAKRYGNIKRSTIVFDKVREPLTGEITGLTTVEGLVARIPYLIQDDLCDGGRTFIEVAKKLYELGATEVHLYVSHGIFSKGLEPLREAGIRRIFTHKGEVLNETFSSSKSR